MPDEPALTQEQITQLYAAVRGQIEHEDNLIAQRLSWLVASQSFLFTAYAITTSGPLKLRLPVFEEQQMLLLKAVPLMGVLTTALIYCGLVAGTWVMFSLRQFYRTRVPVPSPLRPPIQSFSRTLYLGQAAPLLLPLAFLVTWFLIWMRSMGS